MAKKALRECKKIGCTNLTRNTYCDDHIHIKEEQEKRRHQYYSKNRTDNDYQEFYQSKGWKVKKAMAKKRDKYLCVMCLNEKKITPCQAAHHITPIQVDWSKRLELDNLISLCEHHHQLVHREMRR